MDNPPAGPSSAFAASPEFNLDELDLPTPTEKQQTTLNRRRRDSENSISDYTAAFIYKETDTHKNEFSELYSYSEEPEFKKNVEAFQDLLSQFKYPPSWRILTKDKRINAIMQILNLLDSQDKIVRDKASRCILYIVQGCWGDLLLESEHAEAVRENVILLYRFGAFSSLVDLLRFEMLNFKQFPTFTIGDSEELRVVCAALYTITEIFRQEKELGDNSQYRSEVKDFCDELCTPIKGEFLFISLLKMISKYMSAHHAYCIYPMRKVVLLLWKIYLITLGGLEEAEKIKKDKRAKAKLSSQHDKPKYTNKKFSLFSRKVNYMPKVRHEDYVYYLERNRVKFVGYSLFGDQTTTAGLPHTICESLQVLKNHIYTPLALLQMAEEETVSNCPLTNKVKEIEMNLTEIIYQAMLPEFEGYISGLVKILFYSIPSPSRETKEFNPLIAELLPNSEDMPEELPRSWVLNIDVLKHEEVVLKATSSILLLLMKHFRANHVYQFEYLAQCMLVANVIRNLHNFCMMDKISLYLRKINEVQDLNYPTFLIGYQPELTMDCLGIPSLSSVSWRNMCLCVNLLRIFNKIAKWKEARIMRIVTLGTYQPLLNFACLKNKTLKYYALKLLKMQMKYLGKAWHRNYMSVVSEMYYNIRYHLNDKFLLYTSHESVSGKKLLRATEEARLCLILRKFNERRRSNNGVNDASKSIDEDDPEKVCSLSEDFKKNYEKWLAVEVFNESQDCDIIFY